MVLSELRASAWKYACLVCAVLAVAAVLATLAFWGRSVSSRARADTAEARTKALSAELRDTRQALATERDHALALWRVGAQYEQDKIDAEAQHQRDLADLRAGNLRLRKQWTCPASAPSGEPDGQAELREQGAADIIRLAREADAQIRGLQEVVQEDRRDR